MDKETGKELAETLSKMTQEEKLAFIKSLVIDSHFFGK